MNLYAISERPFWRIILISLVTNRFPNLYLAVFYLRKRQDRELRKMRLKLAVAQRRLQEARARGAKP